MTIYRTGTDLGWAPAQDVGDVLKAFLATMSSDDVLHFEDRYRVKNSGNTMTPGTHFTAVTGAGLTIFEPESNQNPMLSVTSDCSLTNFTLLTESPDFQGFKISVNLEGSGITIRNSRLEGSGNILVNSSADDVLLEGTELKGTLACIRALGGKDWHIRNCYFHDGGRYSPGGDAIKTGANGNTAAGAARWLIEDCVFERFTRDAIDTTGGFSDSIIRRCQIRDCQVSALDLKTLVDTKEKVTNVEIRNQNILFEDSVVTNAANAIVLTTLDRPAPNTSAAGTYHWLDTIEKADLVCVQNITVRRVAFEVAPDFRALGSNDIVYYAITDLLGKFCHTVAFEDCVYRGAANAPAFAHWTYPDESTIPQPEPAPAIVSKTSLGGYDSTMVPGWTNYGLTKTGATREASRPMRTDIPFFYGPREIEENIDSIWVDENGVLVIDTNRSGSVETTLTIHAKNRIGAAASSTVLLKIHGG